jgi:hypothetical protein
VLLQTWNRVYYRYRTFDHAHVTRIEQMVSTYRAAIAGYRTRAIDTLNGEERATIVRLFQTFEDVLGPVGASKALHLLAPGLFPSGTARSPRPMRSRLGRSVRMVTGIGVLCWSPSANVRICTVKSQDAASR